MDATTNSHRPSRSGGGRAASARSAGSGSPIPYRLTNKAMRETDIQAEILAALGVNQRRLDGKLSGVHVGRDGMYWRQNSGGAKKGDRWIKIAPRGTADILGVCCGIPLALEVKRPKEQANPYQTQWRAWWEAAGGVYRVVRSWQEALAVLDEIRHDAGAA